MQYVGMMIKLDSVTIGVTWWEERGIWNLLLKKKKITFMLYQWTIN